MGGSHYKGGIRHPKIDDELMHGKAKIAAELAALEKGKGNIAERVQLMGVHKPRQHDKRQTV